MSARAPSRYDRPRRAFSVLGIVLGLILGMGVGLAYAWVIAPVEEIDVEPWQLETDAKDAFIAAAALAYAQDDNLARALDRLIALRLSGDPIQAMADAACRFATTGYVNSSSGLRAVRAMMNLYQLQGRAGCADQLVSSSTVAGGVVEVELPTPLPTLTAPASKTPTPNSAQPTATPVTIIIPTRVPRTDFQLISVTTSCSSEQRGIIAVEVYALNGATGIPAVEVRARWDTGESRFFTGLQPERSPAYSDFEMEAGRDYIIDLPDRADPIPQPLSAVPCTTPAGEASIISYRVLFRSVG